MKKISIKLMAVLACVLMVMSFASCGGNGKFASVADYVNSDIVQNQLESMMDTVDSMGMDIKVYGEDNKLVYEYKFDTQMDNVDAMAAALDSSLESQASTFEGVANSMKEVVNVDNPVVKVVYLNADGSEIFSKEFQATK